MSLYREKQTLIQLKQAKFTCESMIKGYIEKISEQRNKLILINNYLYLKQKDCLDSKK